MTCEFRDDVAAQLLGGLPPPEALRVDQHVLGCDTCAQYRRRMTIVRTVLDGMDRDLAGRAATPGSGLPGPAGLQLSPRHADVTIHRMLQARREHRSSGRLVPFLAGVAAAVLAGVLPLAAYAWTQRSGGSASIELVGTAAAPGAWGEVKLHPRTDGTIVDFEAGDLPRDSGGYQVTVTAHDTVLAQQDLTVGTDGWGQIVLTTTQPLDRGYTITVTRRDGPRLTPVLTGHCQA
ncbi:MAG TPA: zf-HC2 domain-containing protein [Kineosporiaceae bacterium]